MDPRPVIIKKRLAPISRIIAVGGGKGGVGKTTVATLLALGAAANGAKVGLLDLDIHGAAAHLFLGIDPEFPEENHGIMPLNGPHGLHFMSATAFSRNLPLALRGVEVTDAITELLAVTIWPELDLLFVDLPPGLGESLLDLLRFIPRARIVAVTTPSKPALGVTDRFLSAVSSRAPVLGVIANMVPDGHPAPVRPPDLTLPAWSLDFGEPLVTGGVVDLDARYGVPVLAVIPADSGLEAAFGRAEALGRTGAAKALAEGIGEELWKGGSRGFTKS